MAQSVLDLYGSIFGYYYLRIYYILGEDMRAFAQQPKVSPTSMPTNEAEEWLNEFAHKRAENKPNGGIIQSTPSVVFTDRMGERLTPSEHKKAKRQAQKEFKAAMREVAKQEEADKKAIAKKLKEWATVTPEPRVLGKVTRRLDELEARLKSGEIIEVPKSHGETRADYHNMRRDIRAMKNRIEGKVIRLKAIGSHTSYWLIDTLPTYGGALDAYSTEAVRQAVETKTAIRITGDMYQKEVKSIASIMQRLARRKGVAVSSIYGLDNTLKGWAAL